MVVALQALDAAGKDGAIKHVMTGLNPQGVTVHSFKTPVDRGARAPLPVAHDAASLPRRGQIGIFNRSHYEEVLVVRVHPEFLAGQHLPPSATKGDIWKRRFREINDWERTLVDNGFPIVKVFLHLSNGGAAAPAPRSHRHAGQELEVLDGRRPRARPLGRLPAPPTRT